MSDDKRGAGVVRKRGWQEVGEPASGGVWKPSKPKVAKAKRRISTHDPANLARNWPEATDDGLTAVLAQMGPTFTLDTVQRKRLLDGMNHWANGISHIGIHNAGKPSRSETIERLASIKNTAEKLYGLFEPTMPPEQAWDCQLHSAHMNRNLWAVLRVGAHGQTCESEAAGNPPLPPDDKLLSTAINAVAALSIFARRAMDALSPSDAIESPDQGHAMTMAYLYREAFHLEPTKYVNSPWIKFLAWARSVAKLPIVSPERLKRYPIKPVSPPTLEQIHKLNRLIAKAEERDPLIEAVRSCLKDYLRAVSRQ